MFITTFACLCTLKYLLFLYAHSITLKPAKKKKKTPLWDKVRSAFFKKKKSSAEDKKKKQVHLSFW